jgi:formylglycine-generating enzyme required for sulfatase activity
MFVAIFLVLLPNCGWAGSAPQLSLDSRPIVRKTESFSVAEAVEIKSIGPFGQDFQDPVTGMEFVWVPGGTFQMGNIWDDGSYICDWEKPVHKVTVNGFYMGKYPVTQKEYELLMGINPSNFNEHPQHPVNNVSWNDAKMFIAELNKRSGRNYRLPSEAEWEFATRGNRDDQWSGTSDETQVWKYAWYKKWGFWLEEQKEGTSPVDLRLPNPFGLHDMSGNVWELCEDRWHENYNGAPDDGSAWLAGNEDDRVIRGGSWDSTMLVTRTSNRNSCAADIPFFWYGFRLAL